MIAIYLKVEKKTEKILEAKFESYGCAANIASASALTGMVKGKTLRDAWNVSDDLGGLPSVKYRCGILAVGALKRAIRAYYTNKPKPKWLPKEYTSEEKHALEEEKLLEVLAKRAQRIK